MNITCFQIDAIPTVGFSDPILKYFSALRFIFDSVRMFREGYKKVIYLSFSNMHPSSNQTEYPPIHRQDQVYSKLQGSGDGWCSFPDPSYLMISGGLQMMSCPFSNLLPKYASMHQQKTGNTHNYFLDPSTRIHARLVEHKRQVPSGYITFQIDTK